MRGPVAGQCPPCDPSAFPPCLLITPHRPLIAPIAPQPFPARFRICPRLSPNSRNTDVSEAIKFDLLNGS
ncbi:hypothetical protein GCM10009549_13410 [Streptomyces thermoalcalitolerans]|uniref:Uncharacterized protein n=1 Tax=Streptomyces thermoalcalitolerans TaxID=65605 RepID=A0ABP3YV05_9ACTN